MEVRRAHWAGPGLHALIGGSSWPCEATKLCFAPTSRPSTFFSVTTQDVDARDKPGHDGGASTARRRRIPDIALLIRATGIVLLIQLR
jgi:hypothetical protein